MHIDLPDLGTAAYWLVMFLGIALALAQGVALIFEVRRRRWSDRSRWRL